MCSSVIKPPDMPEEAIDDAADEESPTAGLAPWLETLDPDVEDACVSPDPPPPMDICPGVKNADADGVVDVPEVRDAKAAAAVAVIEEEDVCCCCCGPPAAEDASACCCPGAAAVVAEE